MSEYIQTFCNEDIVDDNISLSNLSIRHIQRKHLFNLYIEFIYKNVLNAIWCNAVANECEQI